jgi:hypothetical protein
LAIYFFKLPSVSYNAFVIYLSILSSSTPGSNLASLAIPAAAIERFVDLLVSTSKLSFITTISFSKAALFSNIA